MKLYKLPDGTTKIEFKDQIELIQDIDLTTLFD